MYTQTNTCVLVFRSVSMLTHTLFDMYQSPAERHPAASCPLTPGDVALSLQLSAWQVTHQTLTCTHDDQRPNKNNTSQSNLVQYSLLSVNTSLTQVLMLLYTETVACIVGSLM